MQTPVFALLCALVLAPAAAAEYYEGKPDCPPEMLCTTSVSDEPAAPASSDAPVGLAALAGLGALAGVLAVRRR